MSRIALAADRIFDGEQLAGPGVVLVDDGLIADVVAAAPSDWPVREVRGTILPGLIDAHVHLCADSGPGALERAAGATEEALFATIEQSLQVQLAAGVTTVRDLGDYLGAVLTWRTGAVPGLPHVVAAGAPITSVGGHCWYLGGEVDGVEQIRAAVRQRAAMGADIVKVMASGGALTPGTDTMRPQFTHEVLRAAVAEAHDQGLPITVHAHAQSAVRQALAAGVDGIEHCTCLTPEGVRIDGDLVADLAAAGIAVSPTLGSDPSIVVPPEVLEMVAKAGIREAALQQAARRLADGGVRIVAGSDGGIGPAKPHGLLPATLAEYVTSGIPAVAALTAATSTAADVLGLRKGRIRSGYDADLLVVRADPTEDITTLADPIAIFLGGHPVEIEQS
ncbi:amidohydrolase family protein [Kribbella sp. NPDC023855]|uniref:amidohydrolase family protein n=1 Tax=Kribbella sp. NPDC023855 TaxID=3154698 RepID=UPI0033E771DF